jgi:D-alanyl-D-alanine carboxypeptidase/D-alanyl-D-alanine-endopeptidase (penicillin-binding protein 4)
MQQSTSVRLVTTALVALVITAGSTAHASNPPSPPEVTGPALESVPGLDPAALEVMTQAPYAQARWAVAVKDMDTGDHVVSLNADTFFEPGSVVKTYSIGAAWQEFGPASTIVTPVKTTGPVVGGVLEGDLILVGMGDITMDGRTKADGTVDFTNLDHNDANGVPGATLTTGDPLTGLNNLAAQVKASGIDMIVGDVIVDDRLWDQAELDDEPITPIIINQNLIDLTTTPAGVGEPASIVMSPVVAPWTLDNRVTTVAAGTKDTGFTARSDDQKTIILEGTIAEDADPTLKVVAFDDPATFARTAYIEALRRAGVAVTADLVAVNPVEALPPTTEVDSFPTVAELTSLPFLEEATYTMKISYNRGAQTFMCRLAVASGSTDCDDGLVRAAEIWSEAGLDTSQAVLIDGSGLPGNKITANNEVELQSVMAGRPDAAEWRSTMPLLGIDGSLALVQEGTPSAGKVIGKTGTLAEADIFNGRYFLPTKALGGYMDTESGRRFAFTIMVNGSVFTDVEGLFAANDDVGKVAASIQQSY